MVEELSLVKIYKKYIKGTSPEQEVLISSIFLVNLTNVVKRICGLQTAKVYISTKVIKHLYDRKPAEEFDFIIRNMAIITRFPDHIYRNKTGKRGEFCFVKELRGCKYMSVVESVCLQDSEYKQSVLVTCFRLRDEDYLKSYLKIWSWKGGDLHRNAFDTDSHRSNRTPQ